MNQSAVASLPRAHPVRHDVQFYADDDAFVASVSAFIGEGLARGYGGIVVATGPHRAAIQSHLATNGFAIRQLISDGRLVVLDAAETLAHFMDSGMPRQSRFAEAVTATVHRACASFPMVRIFGEMVDLLSAAGNHTGALALEGMWNALLTDLPAHLLCGYRMDRFAGEAHRESFTHVCRAHACVAPTEEYTRIRDADEQTRAIAVLQQKAAALAEEIRQRQQSDQALFDFFENAAVGFHLVAEDGTILRANRAELALLGYAADEYVGHKISEFHVDADNIAGILRRLTAGETLRSHRARLRCKDGAIKHVLIDSNVLWEAGRFVNTRCSTRDITDQVVAEAAFQAKADELVRSNADLEQFTAIASHDMQEPLRMIASYLGLVEQRYSEKLDGKAQHFIGVAKDGAKRLLSLTKALLGYAHANTANLQIEVVPIAEPLADALANLAASIHDKRAVVTHDPLPAVSADRTQITQVLQNLLSNAIKFCRERDPAVHVSAARQDREWRFTVRDNGIGIPAADQAKIFDMLQRLNTREAFEGNGIGLATCHRIVQRHGGRIWVESREGEGSAFHFTLPFAPA